MLGAAVTFVNNTAIYTSTPITTRCHCIVSKVSSPHNARAHSQALALLHLHRASRPNQSRPVDKLRSGLSSGTSKLSGVFKSGGDNSSLQQLSNAERSAFSEPTLPRLHLILHGVTIFFTFLGICTMAAVAGFQGKWVGVSGGTGFTLFLLLLAFLLSVTLLVIPLIYDRWDKCRRPAQFLSQPRSTFILHAFGAILMIVAALIVTVGAWGQAGCKNPDNDPHAELGDDFKDGLKGWCRTKRASSIFAWLALAGWAGLVALAGIEFRNDRRVSREPSFMPPPTPVFGETMNSNSSAPYAHVGGDDDVFGDKHEAQAPHQASYGYTQPAPHINESAMARPSVDVYGAFDGDMPGARRNDEPSRTMQLAYSDPYAQVRASVANDGGYGQAPPYNAPQPYGNQAAPGYGYR